MTEKNETMQAPQEHPMAALKRALEKQTPALIAAANNDRKRAERLVGIMSRVVSANPDLLMCSTESIIRCARYCAEIGLEPGEKGEVYLVRYGQGQNAVCQAMLSYKGEIALAYRTGKVAKIIGRAVYEGDRFTFNAATDEIEHTPTFNEEERGQIIAAYARAVMKTGDNFVAVLSRADIERHRARSKTANNPNGPWSTDYAPMAVKSAMHELYKWLPGADVIAEIDADEADVSVIPEGATRALPPSSGPNGALRASLGVGANVEA